MELNTLVSFPDPYRAQDEQWKDDANIKYDSQSSFKQEMKEVFHLSWSLFFIQLFNFAMMPIALLFCGRLGDDQLAAVALVGSILEAVVVSVATGLATACDTVFAQSYGSTNKTEYGVYLIKSVAIILLFTFPTVSLLVNLEPLLLMIGEPECVVRLTNEYLIVYSFAVPAIFLNQILMQYLRCQEILWPTVFIGAIGIVMCIIAHYVFVWGFAFGVQGSAYAMLCSHFSVTASLVAYILLSKAYVKTWRGWSMDILQGWGMFLEMAIAGFFMIGLEWWAWETGVISAGLLGVKELGASSIILQIIIIDYQLPISIGLAVNIRVGYHLGNKNINLAKRVFYCGLLYTVIAGILLNVTLFLLAKEIGKLFTDDPEVISIVARILPIGALIEVVDAVICVYGGVIRGCGRQLAGTAITIIGFYLVGIPLALLLEFYMEWGLDGFYWGLLAGMVAALIAYIVIVHKTDWKKMVHMAQVRAGLENRNIEDSISAHPHTYNNNSRGRLTIEEHRQPGRSDYHNSHNSVTSQHSICTQTYNRHLSVKELLWRRTLFIVFMILTLLAGIVIQKQGFSDYSTEEPCFSNLTEFIYTYTTFSPI